MVISIIDIITMASTYAVIGTGLVIIYKTSRVINLAIGELFMLGPYFIVTSSFVTGRGLLMVPLGLVLFILFGILIYLVVMRPAFGQPPIVGILLTAGLAIFLRGVAILVWGPQLCDIESALGVADRPYFLPGGLVVGLSDIVILATAVAVIGGLSLFLHFSQVGIRMRATAENSLLSAYRGINFNVIMLIAWGMLSLLMLMVGINYAVSVRLEPGISGVGLKALAVPLVGGLDSLGGVVPAAIIIAAVEYLTMRWISMELAQVSPYVIVIIVLMIKPWGLLGTHEEIERV